MTLFSEKEDLIAVVGAIGSLEAAVALYYPALMIPDDWRDNYKTVEEIPEETDRGGMKLGRIFFMTIREFSTYDHIGGYKGPVLIIHGDRDVIVQMGVVEKAVKIYDDAKVVVLPGEGHGFTPEGTRKAAELILRFLEEH